MVCSLQAEFQDCCRYFLDQEEDGLWYWMMRKDGKGIGSFLLGSGTSKNSKLPLRPWDLEKFRHISSYFVIFPETWDMEKF